MDLQSNKTDGVVLPVTNTRVSASEWNQVAGSCMAIITDAGLTPDASDNTQLLNAVKSVASADTTIVKNTATKSGALTINGTAAGAFANDGINIGNSSSVASGMSYQVYSPLAIGTSANASRSYSVAIGAKATVTGSNATLGSYGVAIGGGGQYDNATYAETNCVAIGSTAQAKGTSAVAVGYGANTSNNSNSSIVIGYQAKTTADGACQLGNGTNATANSLQFRSTVVVNGSGKIPMASTDVTSLPGYDASKTQVLKNVQGTLTWVDEA